MLSSGEGVDMCEMWCCDLRVIGGYIGVRRVIGVTSDKGLLRVDKGYRVTYRI